MTLDHLRNDPFRLCFPVGLALALYASIMWAAYIFLDAGAYPGLSHARSFVGGFLYYFIVGFLMTAIPRFTQTFIASATEVVLLMAQIFVTLSAYAMGIDAAVWMGLLSGWVLLIVFGGRRFLRRSQNPPPTFVFVGLGILLGLVGLTSMTVFHAIPGASPMWLKIGKICVYDTMVLSFILGVGGRLIPGMFGLNQADQVQLTMTTSTPPFLRTIPMVLHASVIIYIVSVVLEALALPTAAYLIRAAVITVVAIQYWQLHRTPERRTWFAAMVRTSCWMLLLGAWLMAATPHDPIAAKHVMYIGGYLLLTLLVGGRVVTSHSGAGGYLEERRHPYLTIGAILVLAAVTRASANIFPNVYNSHLGYAAVCVMIVVVVWVAAFGSVLFRKRLR